MRLKSKTLDAADGLSLQSRTYGTTHPVKEQKNTHRSYLSSLVIGLSAWFLLAALVKALMYDKVAGHCSKSNLPL